MELSRSYLKKVFWPNLCVGSSFQVLDILQYACGLKLGSALTLNQNPDFEMASSRIQQSPKSVCVLSLVILFTLAACSASLSGSIPEPATPAAEAPHEQDLRRLLAALPPDGWELYGVEEYGAGNLWKKINGNAELFLSYDVVGLTFASLVKTGDTGQYFDLYLYDMGSPINAFGVFSVERFAGESPVNLGREAYQSGAGYFIWQGRYYIQIQASEPTEAFRQIGMDLASGITQAIEDSREPVWGLSLLPEAGLAQQSIKYFLVDAMGLDFMRNTFTAEYRRNDTLVRLFLSRQDSAESARAVVTQYTEFAAEYGDGVEPLTRGQISMFACDMGGLYDVVFQRGRLVGGVLAVEDKDVAASAAADLWKSLSP